MEDQERYMWFRKQHTLHAGRKRTWPELLCENQHVESGGVRDFDQDHYQPYWLWKQPMIIAGESETAVSEKWR